MNKWVYLSLIVGGNVLTAVLFAIAVQPGLDELLVAVPIPAIVAAVAFLMLIYRMWGALPRPPARTSPAAAAGLLLVPVFNLFWIFQVLPGFATDFNRFAASRGAPARVPFGLMVAYILCSPIPVVGLIVQIFAILRICDGVNALQLGAAGPTYLPVISSAVRRREYVMGDYWLVLLDHVRSSPIHYHFVLLVYRQDFPFPFSQRSRSADIPCLAVASEYLDEESARLPFLGVFAADGHHNLGAFADLVDIERFAARAVEVAKQYLNLPANQPVAIVPGNSRVTAWAIGGALGLVAVVAAVWFATSASPDAAPPTTRFQEAQPAIESRPTIPLSPFSGTPEKPSFSRPGAPSFPPEGPNRKMPTFPKGPPKALPKTGPLRGVAP